MSNEQRTRRYVERYALAEARRAAEFVQRENARASSSLPRFSRTLCVPMFDETTHFVNRLLAHPSVHNTLLIVCVNAPDTASQKQLTATRQLVSQLAVLGDDLAQAPHLWLRKYAATQGELYVLVMDHCTNGRCLPASEGVGRARRLAADVALALHMEGLVASRWLYQTDADATLSDHYFDDLENHDAHVAVHTDFRHNALGDTSLSQQLYDLSLDYYVAGLHCAGSPFAHYSLGSALIIDSSAYAAVRGYPRRSAGEDFYMMNKLAKHGPIAFDRTRRVTLAERLSERVPFGTGPGVRKLSELTAPLEAPVFYAPASFIALRQWLEFVHQAVTGRALFQPDTSSYLAFTSTNPSGTLVDALAQMKLFDWLDGLLDHYGSGAQAQHQAKLGMDALKTLKLIHTLRDSGYSNVTAVDAATWMIQSTNSQTATCVRAVPTALRARLTS